MHKLEITQTYLKITNIQQFYKFVIVVGICGLILDIKTKQNKTKKIFNKYMKFVRKKLKNSIAFFPVFVYINFVWYDWVFLICI